MKPRYNALQEYGRKESYILDSRTALIAILVIQKNQNFEWGKINFLIFFQLFEEKKNLLIEIVEKIVENP